MEPVTHILTGACLARTGLHRRAAYTTATMAIAAEFPDIDTLWSLRGPVASFQHHRGITHTFLGIPFEAALIVGLVYLMHLWRMRHDRVTNVTSRRLTAAPPHFGLLYLFALLALLTHIALDYTNNYGVRPFFPFNPRWYAASITFIFDPCMFLLLLAALVLPAIFRLIGSEVGAKRQHFAAPGWAVVALAGVLALWGVRFFEHTRAIELAMTQSVPVPGALFAEKDSGFLQPEKVLANPDPFSPFRWWTVTDFGPLYQLGEANTRNNAFYSAQQTVPKAMPSPELEAAERSPLGRAYLDWSPMPFLTVLQRGSEQMESGTKPGHARVTFRDPRFMGNFALMRSRHPLEGTVELDRNNRVVGMTMDGKEQR